MRGRGGPGALAHRRTASAAAAVLGVAVSILLASPALAVRSLVTGGSTSTTSTTTSAPTTTTTTPPSTTTAPTTTSTTAPATAQQASVAPILECVWHVDSTNWLALWGYTNSSSTTQSIAVGSNNSFAPGAADQGQPTSFSPGTNDNVFVVPFVASDPPAWTLDGSTVPSSPSDKKCSEDPVPIVAGTTQWSALLVVVLLALGILGVGIVCWRIDPELLALRSPSRRTRRD